MRVNRSQPKIRLVSPLERAGRNGETFSITHNDDRIFVFQYFPDYVFPVFGALALVLLSIILVFFNTFYTIIAVGFLGFLVVYIIMTRDLECTFDKQNGTVFHIRGGLLSGSLDRQETQFPISEIKHIIMQQYVGRYHDKFQVQLKLRSGKILPISGRDLGIADCQDIAQKMCAFLGFDPASVQALD